MVTANGRLLPAEIISRPGYELVLRWASIQYDTEDGYVGTSGYEDAGEGRAISLVGPSSGHHTRAGDRVTFQGYEGHDRITGRVSGNRLVLTVDTATLVYVRRGGEVEGGPTRAPVNAEAASIPCAAIATRGAPQLMRETDLAARTLRSFAAGKRVIRPTLGKLVLWARRHAPGMEQDQGLAGELAVGLAPMERIEDVVAEGKMRAPMVG
jgi:hypothetical protein